MDHQRLPIIADDFYLVFIIMRLNRLLAITIMLINRRKVTAPELAEHFGVSIRTIYRDIAVIQSAGIPMASCQGFEGGFSIMENYRISRQVLTFQDICSLITTLKGINHTLNSHELAEAIEKISCLVPEDKEEEFSQLSEQIGFDITPWSFGRRQDEYLEIVHHSISTREVILFVYTDFNSQVTQRMVEPMTLVFKSNAWYLFGYCRYRCDYRMFKLSRIRELSNTGEHFTRKNASWRDMVPADPLPKHPVPLKLLFSPQSRVKAEDHFEPSQLHLRENGFMEVNLTVDEDEWLYSWLLSFIGDVEVVEPHHIRRQLLEKVKTIQKKYVT